MTAEAEADQRVEVDAHPEVGVRNSQKEGIGRVANLGTWWPGTISDERCLRRPAVATARHLRHHLLPVRRRAV